MCTVYVFISLFVHVPAGASVVRPPLNLHCPTVPPRSRCKCLPFQRIRFALWRAARWMLSDMALKAAKEIGWEFKAYMLSSHWTYTDLTNLIQRFICGGKREWTWTQPHPKYPTLRSYRGSPKRVNFWQASCGLIFFHEAYWCKAYWWVGHVRVRQLYVTTAAGRRGLRESLLFIAYIAAFGTSSLGICNFKWQVKEVISYHCALYESPWDNHFWQVTMARAQVFPAFVTFVTVVLLLAPDCAGAELNSVVFWRIKLVRLNAQNWNQFEEFGTKLRILLLRMMLP